MTGNDASAQDGKVTNLIGIAADGLELIKLEWRLARQETIENLSPVARSSGMVVGGGILAVFGSTYLIDAVVRLLATIMPHWLASLLSGLGLTAGGVALMRRGRDELAHTDLVPHKTLNSLKEDREWLRHQIKSRLI